MREAIRWLRKMYLRWSVRGDFGPLKFEDSYLDRYSVLGWLQDCRDRRRGL